MRLARGLLAALVLSTLAAGCGHTPWKPWAGWQVYRTKNITLYTATRFVHSTTLTTLELAHATLAASLFPKRRIAPVEVLFLEEPLMQGTLGRFRNGTTIAKLPGHGSLGRRGLIVMRENAYDAVAKHQLAHAFLHAMAPAAPLWLHEGYAAFVEASEYRKQDQAHIVCLGYLGSDKKLVTLDELFGWKWSELERSEKADWYRQTARALIDYLMMAEKGALRLKLADLAGRVSNGEDTRTALAAIFPGVSTAELLKRIQDYHAEAESEPRGAGPRAEGVCPVAYQVAPDRQADLSEPRVEAVPPVDIEELFGRLWMLPHRQGRVDWYPPAVITLEGLSKT